MDPKIKAPDFLTNWVCYKLYTATVNYPKKPLCFFKEQNAGFSAQIYRVILTKPG